MTPRGGGQCGSAHICSANIRRPQFASTASAAAELGAIDMRLWRALRRGRGGAGNKRPRRGYGPAGKSAAGPKRRASSGTPRRSSISAKRNAGWATSSRRWTSENETNGTWSRAITRSGCSRPTIRSPVRRFGIPPNRPAGRGATAWSKTRSGAGGAGAGTRQRRRHRGHPRLAPVRPHHPDDSAAGPGRAQYLYVPRLLANERTAARISRVRFAKPKPKDLQYYAQVWPNVQTNRGNSRSSAPCWRRTP
jgi:hypothetical protein